MKSFPAEYGKASEFQEKPSNPEASVPFKVCDAGRFLLFAFHAVAMLVNTLIAMDSATHAAFGHDIILFPFKVFVACSANKLNILHSNSSCPHIC